MHAIMQVIPNTLACIEENFEGISEGKVTRCERLPIVSTFVAEMAWPRSNSVEAMSS